MSITQNWENQMMRRFEQTRQTVLLRYVWAAMEKQIRNLSHMITKPGNPNRDHYRCTVHASSSRASSRLWTCCPDSVVDFLSQHPFLPIGMVFQHPEIGWDMGVIRRFCLLSKEDYIAVTRRHYHRHNSHLWKTSCERFRTKTHSRSSCKRSRRRNPAWWMPSHSRPIVRIGNVIFMFDQKIDRLDYFRPIHADNHSDLFRVLEQRLFMGKTYPVPRYRRWSRHPRFPLTFVLRFPKKPWDFHFLIQNRYWTEHDIDACIAVHRFDFRAFSHNPYLNLDILLRYRDSPWDWRVLAVHPCFPPQRVWNWGIDSLLNKWRWPDTYRNPKIDTVMFNLLSRTYRWETTHLLENMFYHDPFAIRTAAYKIQDFVSSRYQTQKLLARLHATITISRILPISVLLAINSFLTKNEF